MSAALISLLAPLLIKAVDFWLDARKAKAETRKKWLAFIDQLSNDNLISAELAVSYKAQREALENETNQEKGPETN